MCVCCLRNLLSTIHCRLLIALLLRLLHLSVSSFSPLPVPLIFFFFLFVPVRLASQSAKSAALVRRVLTNGRLATPKQIRNAQSAQVALLEHSFCCRALQNRTLFALPRPNATQRMSTLSRQARARRTLNVSRSQNALLTSLNSAHLESTRTESARGSRSATV